MSLIKLKVVLNDKKEVEAIYDSGSNATLVNYDLLQQMRTRIFKKNCILKTLSGVDFIQNRAKIRLRINKIDEEIEAYVVRNSDFCYDLLLGLDAIRKFKLIQDEDLRIFQRISGSQIQQIECVEPVISERIEGERKRDGEPDKRARIDVFMSEYQKIDEIELEHLSEENRLRLVELVRRHEKVFATHKFDVGSVKNHEAEIKLLEDR